MNTFTIELYEEATESGLRGAPLPDWIVDLPVDVCRQMWRAHARAERRRDATLAVAFPAGGYVLDSVPPPPTWPSRDVLDMYRDSTGRTP